MIALIPLRLSRVFATTGQTQPRIQSQSQSQRSNELKMIKGLRDQRRESQETFYKIYFGKMFPIALRYGRNREDAQEIINTAFLKVINSISAYRDDNFGGWVSTIVKRTAIDHCRKGYFKNSQVTSELIDIDTKVYNEAISNLEVEEILNLLPQLPDSSRTVFNLFVFEELSHQEVADKLNIAVGTSKWHVSQARTLLLDLIKKSN